MWRELGIFVAFCSCLLHAPASRGEIGVSGRVLATGGEPLRGAGGEPVAGAAVHAEAAASAHGGVSGEALYTTADGSFAIADLRPGGKVDLRVRKAGYRSALVAGVEIPADEALTVVLEEAWQVFGRVLDDAGRGVARARLTLTLHGPGPVVDGRMISSPAGRRSSLSGADGVFVIDDVAAGRYSLTAAAEGFRTAEGGEIEVTAGSGAEELTVRLERGAALAGRVTTATGRPAIGAQVVLRPAARPAAGPLPGRPAATTDGDGRYLLEGLDPGPASVEVRHRDHARSVRDLQVRPGFQQLDLTVEPGFEVEGRVVTGSGAPVAGAALFLEPAGPRAATRTDGTFALSGVADGRYRIRIAREGYPSVLGAEELHLAGSSVYGLEVRVEEGGTVAGLLYGLDFDELARVEVRARDRSGSGVRGVVDYEGGYRIDRLPPGEWTVAARLPGGEREAQARVTLERGAGEILLDLDFTTGLTLAGRVSQWGRPVGGALVVVSGDAGAQRQTTTSSTGSFRLQGLAAGRYTLMAVDFQAGLRHALELELVADRDLEVEVGTAQVRGRIVDARDLAPLAGAVVSLQPLAAGGHGLALDFGAASDARGEFLLRGVSAGDWRLSVRKEGYAEAILPVDLGTGAGDLEIRLTATSAR